MNPKDRKPSFFERLTGGIHDDTPNDTPIHRVPGRPAERERTLMEDTKRMEPPRETPRTLTPENAGVDEEDVPEEMLEEEEGELQVDVYQTPEAIVIKSMVAGVKPDKLQVSIMRDMVTIKGSREEEEVVTDGDYYHRELYWGAFSRSVVLPQEVEPDEAKASEKNGLLTITLPKVNREKVSKLKVKSG